MPQQRDSLPPTAARARLLRTCPSVEYGVVSESCWWNDLLRGVGALDEDELAREEETER